MRVADKTSSRRILWGAVCWAAGLPVALAFLAAPTEAGSVFMKNGYIIQGKIVDRSDSSVVLGWDNGKVMIHRRFVDEVVYEAGEEEDLRRLEEARREQVDEGAALSLLEETGDEIEELPASLELFIEKFDLNRPEGGSDQATSVVSLPVNDGNTPDTGTVTVTPIEQPQSVVDSTLGDRQSHSGFGVSLRPPRGWSVDSTPEAFVARGQQGQEGAVTPSLNVVSWPRDAKANNLFEVLAEEQKRTFSDYEVLHTGKAEVGTETAQVVAGRGSFEGSEAMVTQFLVERGERVWLFSAFSPVGDNSDTMEVVEQVLASVEFASN